MSEKGADGNWQKPEELPSNINSSCVKTPRILSDGRTLIFAAKKESGQGEFDIYRAILNSAGKWDNPTPVDFTNTSESEQAGVITEENELISFFRKGDILTQGVPADYILNKVSLTTIDGDNKKIVKSSVKVIDPQTRKEIKADSTNSEGKFSVVLLPGKSYDFVISANGYNEAKQSFGFSPFEDFKRIEQTIDLKPKKKQVVLKISDAETNKGLSVDIKITNLDTKEEIVIHETVGRDGKYSINLREGNRYNVEVSSKEGYAYSTVKIDVPVSKATEENNGNAANNNSDTSSIAVITPEESLVIDHEIKVTPLKKGTKLLLNDIFFEFNSHELQDSSYIELAKVIELLNDNPKINIEINAHTDDVGSDEFNLKLSQRRAQIIVDYLVSKGVNPKRLTAKGFGKSKPVASNETEEGRAKNRRVEMRIVEVK
jgi:outer membrane protein OmpA-like peptidoglycan-associated protein